MTTIDPQFAALELQDLDGRPVRLGDLWKEKPAAIVFVRHFG
jgi:hypothetical protein